MRGYCDIGPASGAAPPIRARRTDASAPRLRGSIQRGGAYQPQVPGLPLNGPTTRDVIQPP